MSEKKIPIGSLFGKTLYVDEDIDEATLRYVTSFLAEMIFKSNQLMRIRSILDQKDENLS